uniref:Uncharacterized protein n=1 Tax=Aegilops tauschii subsp. strangulata TaxID=200361 RepID=A0A453MW85_AEGTS
TDSTIFHPPPRPPEQPNQKFLPEQASRGQAPSRDSPSEAARRRRQARGDVLPVVQERVRRGGRRDLQGVLRGGQRDGGGAQARDRR